MSDAQTTPVIELAETDQLAALLGPPGTVVQIRTSSAWTHTGFVTSVLVDGDRILWIDLKDFDGGPTRIRWSAVESIR